MNILLIIRAEIINIVLLVFLLIYSRYCYRFRTGPDYFLGFVITALGCAVFGLITEITVNTPSTYGPLNDICHVVFYTFNLLFCLTLFRYVLSLVVPRNRIRTILIPPLIICIIAVIVSAVTPKTYIQGNGTGSGGGIGVYLCFGMATLIFIASVVLLIIYRNRIQKSVRVALFPILICAFVLVIIQGLVPEFLFTPGVSTIMCIGAFFAIENPVNKLESKVFLDPNTGVYSRSSYENDIAKLKDNTGWDLPIGIVLCDLNRLKYVNDTYGHLEGDKQILLSVNALQAALKNAYRLYRVGGDEFIGIYKSKSIVNIESDMARIESECKSRSQGRSVEVSVSCGYSILGERGTYEEAMKRADLMMYENKSKYYEKTGFDRRTS